METTSTITLYMPDINILSELVAYFDVTTDEDELVEQGKIFLNTLTIKKYDIQNKKLDTRLIIISLPYLKS